MFDLSFVYRALPVAPFLKTTLTSDERSRDGRAAANRFVRIKEAMMATGTVKWFNPTKGYGFIQPQDGGRDVFVHISAVERAGLSSLNEGQTIEYELVSNRGKEAAENIKAR
jgi:CspA family cold shock protein